MEGDCLCLDLALLDVDFVAGEDDGDVLADTDQITCTEASVGARLVSATRVGCWGTSSLTVPVGDVLVGDARRDVEHDDAAVAVDVVSVPQPTELLLSGGVPDIEDDLA